MFCKIILMCCNGTLIGTFNNVCNITNYMVFVYNLIKTSADLKKKKNSMI